MDTESSSGPGMMTSAPKPVGMSSSSGMGMERVRLKESLRLGLCEEPWLPCESLGDRVSCGSGDADRSSASAHPEEAPADAAKGISAARPVPVPRREEDSGDASSFAESRPPPPASLVTLVTLAGVVPGPSSLMVAFPPHATRVRPAVDSERIAPVASKPSRPQVRLGESQRVPRALRVLERPARANLPGRAPFRAPATRVLAGVLARLRLQPSAQAPPREKAGVLTLDHARAPGHGLEFHVSPEDRAPGEPHSQASRRRA